MPDLRASFWQMSSSLADWAASSPTARFSQSAHEYVIEGPSMSR